MDDHLYAVAHSGPGWRRPVSREVPVRLQAQAGELSRFGEDTQTVLVFPEGAVLRVAAPLEPGQRILLTNRATRRQQPCRVVYARENRSVKGYVEVEFALPAPGFWEDAPAAPQIHDPFGELPPVTRAAAEAIPESPASDPLAGMTTIAEAPAFERHVPARDQPVHAPAPPPPLRRESVRRSFAATPPVEESLVPDIETLLRARRADEEAAEGFSTRVLHPPVGAFFPARRPRSRRAWYISAAAAALLMTLGTLGLHAGGLWLGPPPAPRPPSPPAWVVPPVELPGLSLYELPWRAPHSRELILLAPGARNRSGTRRGGAFVGTTAVLASPVAASPRHISEVPLPEVGGVPASAEPGGMALQALASSTPAPALPPPIPAVESQLKPLRLVLAVRPVYPPQARKMRTQGEVVLQATIDAAGRPVQMKVLSGPALLHQAALDALAQWKYEPATLNGKPLAVTTAVTIKFQL
jgi:protein TonB